MDLEDRFKFIFVGFGRFRWIRVKCVKIIWRHIWMRLEDLDDSERLCLDLGGFGWIWAQIRVDF